MSFVVIDDYETANAFLGVKEFERETDRKLIGKKMLDEFEKITSELYHAGMLTFLTDRILGDHETFYAHAVRWYFPAIARRTYSKYGLGIGVFTMEGFEAINYMTKRLIRDHTNRRGNICAQTMVRIVMVFMTFEHSVEEQLKLRKKLKEKQLDSINRIHHYDNDDENTQIRLALT